MKEWKRQGRQGATNHRSHYRAVEIRCPKCNNNDPAEFRQCAAKDKPNYTHYNCRKCHHSFDHCIYQSRESLGVPVPVARRNKRK